MYKEGVVNSASVNFIEEIFHNFLSRFLRVCRVKMSAFELNNDTIGC